MTNHKSILAVLQKVDGQIDFSIKSDTEIVNILRNRFVNKNEPLTIDALAEFYAFSLLKHSQIGSER